MRRISEIQQEEQSCARELAARFNVSEIAAKYNYTPLPPTREAKDLKINWDTLSTNFYAESFADFHNAPAKSKMEEKQAIGFIRSGDHGTELLKYETVHTQTKNDPDADGRTNIKLTDPQGNLISHFQIDRDPLNENVWHIPHRITMEEYRAQGIGGKMLEIAEASIQEMADRTGLPQTLKVNPGQLEVLGFFLKNGFLPEGNDDINNLRDFIDSDPEKNNLRILSCPSDKDKDHKRQGYILTQDAIDEAGSHLWEEFDIMNYKAWACRINLKKVFLPRKPHSELHTPEIITESKDLPGETRILLIGSGGREHAIAKAIAMSATRADLFSAQKHSNPGIHVLSKDVIPTETNIEEIIQFCKKNKISIAIIGPERPLSLGIVNALEAAGIQCVGPTKEAAAIETDKGDMRKLMGKYQIPGTVNHLTTSSYSEAIGFCEKLDWKVAVKPLGLTAGKGVRVWEDHLKTPEEVKFYIQEILDKDGQVLIEEKLIGQEFTVQVFTDGQHVVATPAVQDKKRAYENDKGPNTGGMGSYTENLPWIYHFMDISDYNHAIEICQQTINALRKEGRPFKGILYGQFIRTEKGIKVIEFNARFGDPEAINILHLFRGDFVRLCQAIIKNRITDAMTSFETRASVATYLTPQGYPENPQIGDELIIPVNEIEAPDRNLIFASCNFVREDGPNIVIKTTASRTLAIIADARTIPEAQKRVMEAAEKIQGSFRFRNDIGPRQ